MTRSITSRVGLSAASAALAIALAGCAGGGPAGPTQTAGASAGPGHPLHGTWLTSITKSDLAAAGVTDPGLQTENSGQFRWTFSPDGTWTQVQQSIDGAPLNSPVFRGSFTVAGEALVMTTEFPEQYRDAGLHYTWAIDAGALSMDLLDPPDAMLPVVVESHPWTRVP